MNIKFSIKLSEWNIFWINCIKIVTHLPLVRITNYNNVMLDFVDCVGYIYIWHFRNLIFRWLVVILPTDLFYFSHLVMITLIFHEIIILNIISSMFWVFFPHLLKFSPVFLRARSWDRCFSMCLLTSYAMLLPILSIYFLLTMSKFTAPLNLLKSLIYFSLTLQIKWRDHNT
jgi:hypothetical protein